MLFVRTVGVWAFRLLACTWRLERTGWDAFLNTFRQRRKARISIIATQPGADGKPAAEFSGRFVAFAKG